MARRRGRAWGNALGGWRKQRRNRKGQFASGGGSSKAVAKRKKPSRKARRQAKLSKTHIVQSSVSYDLATGKPVYRTQYTRTGAQQRSIHRHVLVGAAAGSVVLPGPGTFIGAAVGANVGAKKNPAAVRRMPI